MFFKKIKKLIIETVFPKKCLTCNKEGTYSCEDCFSLIDFLPKIDFKTRYLDGLISAVSYNNIVTKELITKFKYEPFIKDIAPTLAYLIFHHIKISENEIINFEKEKCLIIPIPSHLKKEKLRNFNPPTEIAKSLSLLLKIPLETNILLKTRQTTPQINLSKKERENNVKNVFMVKNENNSLINKTIFLVDDVFTTGSTLQEAARVLKNAGTKRVIGVTVAKE
jgi:competence protein ComFC